MIASATFFLQLQECGFVGKYSWLTFEKNKGDDHFVGLGPQMKWRAQNFGRVAVKNLIHQLISSKVVFEYAFKTSSQNQSSFLNWNSVCVETIQLRHCLYAKLPILFNDFFQLLWTRKVKPKIERVHLFFSNQSLQMISKISH